VTYEPTLPLTNTLEEATGRPEHERELAWRFGRGNFKSGGLE
jgi:hypothetical protein